MRDWTYVPCDEAVSRNCLPTKRGTIIFLLLLKLVMSIRTYLPHLDIWWKHLYRQVSQEEGLDENPKDHTAYLRIREVSSSEGPIQLTLATGARSSEGPRTPQETDKSQQARPRRYFGPCGYLGVLARLSRLPESRVQTPFQVCTGRAAPG